MNNVFLHLADESTYKEIAIEFFDIEFFENSISNAQAKLKI